ncbi:hypothetical protein EMCRGX_G025045 [Ephydatia muelleri]
MCANFLYTAWWNSSLQVAPIERKLERCRLQELSPKGRKRKSEEVGSATKRSKVLSQSSSLNTQTEVEGISRLPDM